MAYGFKILEKNSACITQTTFTLLLWCFYIPFEAWKLLIIVTAFFFFFWKFVLFCSTEERKSYSFRMTFFLKLLSKAIPLSFDYNCLQLLNFNRFLIHFKTLKIISIFFLRCIKTALAESKDTHWIMRTFWKTKYHVMPLWVLQQYHYILMYVHHRRV